MRNFPEFRVSQGPGSRRAGLLTGTPGAAPPVPDGQRVSAHAGNDPLRLRASLAKSCVRPEHHPVKAASIGHHPAGAERFKDYSFLRSSLIRSWMHPLVLMPDAAPTGW